MWGETLDPRPTRAESGESRGVVLAPLLDQRLRFPDRVGHLGLQQFIAQLPGRPLRPLAPRRMPPGRRRRPATWIEAGASARPWPHVLESELARLGLAAERRASDPARRAALSSERASEALGGVASDLPAGRDDWVWGITPDGGLVVDRCADDGQGRLGPASGGSITRQKIIARRSTAEARSWPFLAAVASLIPEGLVAQARAYAGFGIPDWLAAEMRHALLEQVRDGRFVLAGKLSPVQAEAAWIRFDPTALGTWDFGFDDTARSIVGPGASYVSVTAFTPDEWVRVRKAAGRAQASRGRRRRVDAESLLRRAEAEEGRCHPGLRPRSGGLAARGGGGPRGNGAPPPPRPPAARWPGLTGSLEIKSRARFAR